MKRASLPVGLENQGTLGETRSGLSDLTAELGPDLDYDT